MEIWTDILGYEGIYLVSNLGNIKRIKNGRGVKPNRILKQFIMPNGYCQVALSKNCIEEKFYVHRLVITSFNKESVLETVNHKNGNKLDNSLVNLEYMTRSNNTKHSIHVLKNNKIGINNPNSKLTESDVISIKKLLGKITHKEIANIYGVSRPTITEISMGRKWKHLSMDFVS